MKTVRSEDFRVAVADVLKGAANLHSVVVVGIDSDGAPVVASSVGTPQTLNLLRQAEPHIASL